ncbi:hypothetical protein JW921_07850, partial [Candidatus Fermentibacterales bacterium]|nr:hypothetical protein [Candidatus Fermentibacterales bacterium]
NPIYMMSASGARGSKDQVQQLAGMRGLMAKPRKRLSGEVGETIETPIISSLKEGLSVIEYSISTHGSRKGLADTALKTADAGYLTRRLVDVAQDVVITTTDCGTVRGRVISALKEGEEIIEPLSERILGRVTAEDIFDPATEKIICEAGMEISRELASRIEESGVESVRIRSVLTCEAPRGLCGKCYGWDLSRNRMVTAGEAVGVTAAQSIGEPGTQLTLRTFHVGGVAGHAAQEKEIHARHSGTVSFRNMHIIHGKEDGGSRQIASRTGQFDLLDDNGDVLSSYDIVVGSIMRATDGQLLTKGDVICVQDPFTIPIVAEASGSVHFVDIEEDITVREELDSERRKQMMIVEDRSKTLHPHIFILPEHEVVLSGRPRRREEELRLVREYASAAASGEGRVLFTYREASPARPTSLLEDVEEIMPELEGTACVKVDCRRVATGSYAALVQAADLLLDTTSGARSSKAGKQLASAVEGLKKAGTRRNEDVEGAFVEAILEFARKNAVLVCMASLDKAHAGTRRLVRLIGEQIEGSRLLLMSSFSVRGRRSHVVHRGKQKEKEKDQVEEFIHPRKWYAIPTGAHIRVHDATIVAVGTHLARIERKLGQQKDITGGLPRVDELFEARRPSDAAYIARISGIATLSPIRAGLRTVTIRGEQGQEEDIKIPSTRHIRVHEGDRVEAGDRLTEGPIDPHDILEVKGTEAVEEYLLNEIQEVYRLQGVKINDKHVGIIVRQMLAKAKIEDPGDTRFLEGAQVDRLILNAENMAVLMEGKRPATSKPLLLGMTKASLATDSFLSAASFQETNTVLADAAVEARVDYLRGLKENVIVGHLIPAGTGMRYCRKITLKEAKGGDLPPPPMGDIDEDSVNA